MRLRMTPPQLFAAASLLLIVLTGLAMSVTQSTFFRQAIIDLNSRVMRDMVNAILIEHQQEGKVTPADFEASAEGGSAGGFARAFEVLDNISGIVRIKVFRRDHTIVWSDQPELIGTRLTHHPADVDLAFSGTAHAVIDTKLHYDPREAITAASLIEFYIPFTLLDAAPRVNGVIALYRSPEDLNRTISGGLQLLWLVAGLGSAVLFVSLYKLFQTVYYRQRSAEDRFEKLERLMQVEKLSALGQMVSEIAHQLNNPLVGVVNLAELAQREADNPERVRELLQEVRSAGYHCRDFVQRMMMLNKAAHSAPQTTDMNGLVQETMTFFQQSLGGHPPLALRGPDHAVMIDVDPVLIRHALFNLIHNAAQADPDGPITISLASHEQGSVDGCELTVSDHGPGLSAAVRAKLFTPFFTTRANGTGLGLSVAQQVVVKHGGSIHGENLHPHGARFVIWLPAHRQADET